MTLIKRIIFLIFTICCLFLLATNAFAEHDTLPCCGTDAEFIKELHQELVQEKISQLNKEYNPCSDTVSTFSLIQDKHHTRRSPSVGNVKTLVIPLSFPHNVVSDIQLQNLEQAFNGTYYGTRYDETTNPDYYKGDTRSASKLLYDHSNGKLNMTFDIMPLYNSPYDKPYYRENDIALNKLLAQLLTEYKAKGYVNDYSDYDSDGDGVIDCVVLAFPIFNDWELENDDRSAYSFDTWWSNAAAAGGAVIENDSMKINNRIVLGFSLEVENAYGGFGYSFVHEYGHMMGLNDNYDNHMTSGNCTLYGTYEVMSVGNCGYFNAFYRYLLGWIEPKILPYENNIEKVSLCNYEMSNQNNVEQAIILVPDT